MDNTVKLRIIFPKNNPSPPLCLVSSTFSDGMLERRGPVECAGRIKCAYNREADYVTKMERIARSC